jgi:hypothetical protein
MPIFLDSHHGSDVPIDGVRDFLRAVRSARADPSGVRPLDLYCDDGGRTTYVVEAPDEDTVRQQHAALGVVCRRVRRVHSLRSSGEGMSEEEKAVVRAMVADEQALPGRAMGWNSPDERWSQVG